MANKDNLRVKCKCSHEFQDQLYGKGVRVCTPVERTRVQGKLQEKRCTVCGTIHRA